MGSTTLKPATRQRFSTKFMSAFTKEDCSMVNSLPTEAPPLTIQVHGVQKLLQSLNPNKASGPDEISALFLKEIAPSIAPVLTHIYKACYNQGRVPQDWKGAFVTSLFKKGDMSKRLCFLDFSLFQDHGAHHSQSPDEVP